MNLKVAKLSTDTVEDFYHVHSRENDHDWCFCVAWWSPTWEAWSNRTSEENRQRREQLFDSGIYDGYLFYDGSKAIGWCQCCPGDQLFKLNLEYNLKPNSEIYTITCFIIAPSYREIGLGHKFLELILDDLKNRGIKYVRAFPRRGKDLAVEDLWTGPEQFYLKAGFSLERNDAKYPIYGKQLIEIPVE
ncbi:MAG: GNAT family N-acetyltransferase [Candidatus Zixiibacteriota bacterium]